MAFYIRKISPAKWPQKGENTAVDNVRADAITGDIRTTQDTISLWRTDTEEELPQAVLALASGGDQMVTQNVLLIPEEMLLKYGFILDETDGNTPVDSLVKTHRDIINVNYGSLGKFAQLTMEAINADAIRTVTKKEVKKLIVNAYKNGEINRDRLKDRMWQEIEKELEKSHL